MPRPSRPSRPRTNGTDAAIIAYLRANYRSEIRRATQSPIQYVIATWESHLPATLGSGVLALPDELGGSVSRKDLKRLSQAGTGRIALMRLFVATLMWGRGRSLGFLFDGWEETFAHPALGTTLSQTARLVRQGRPGDAYRHWEAAGLPGIDESFFTKWFYSAGLAGIPDGYLRPLVLDKLVWRSLRALGWSSERASGFKRYRISAPGYCAYLAAVQRWSASLSTPKRAIDEEMLEMFLFHRKGAL
jgi:hypothetical protein